MNIKRLTPFFLAILLIIFYPYITPKSDNLQEKSRVLLVDNLSHLNDDFTVNLENLCKDNNYNLVIHENVDVSFFKELSGTYTLVVLRLHSTYQQGSTWLFTSEVYRPESYLLEQLAGEVHSARVSYSSDVFFVLNSYFLTHYLGDDFSTNCIILMGCNGLEGDDMAQAWISSGADYYLGWNSTVTLEETDLYTQLFIKSYIDEGITSELREKIDSGYFRTNNSCLCLYSKK